MTASIARYYSVQAGNGLHNIGPLYRTPRSGYQRGYGIGSFLSNIAGFLRPYAMKGLESLARQGYKTSKSVIDDLVEKKPLSEIVRNRSKEALLGLTEQGIDTIQRKMKKRQAGAGSINRRPRNRRRAVGGRRPKKSKQVGGRRNKRKTKRRTKKRVLDIFT